MKLLHHRCIPTSARHLAFFCGSAIGYNILPYFSYCRLVVLPYNSISCGAQCSFVPISSALNPRSLSLHPKREALKPLSLSAGDGVQLCKAAGSKLPGRGQAEARGCVFAILGLDRGDIGIMETTIYGLMLGLYLENGEEMETIILKSGAPFWKPNNQNYSTLGSILGSNFNPNYLWKLPCSWQLVVASSWNESSSTQRGVCYRLHLKGSSHFPTAIGVIWGHIGVMEEKMETTIQGLDTLCRYLDSFGEKWGFISSNSANVFLDNHDTQRGEVVCLIQ